MNKIKIVREMIEHRIAMLDSFSSSCAFFAQHELEQLLDDIEQLEYEYAF